MAIVHPFALADVAACVMADAFMYTTVLLVDTYRLTSVKRLAATV
jgi:hypothetical protein